jgi:hypothetical protein
VPDVTKMQFTAVLGVNKQADKLSKISWAFQPDDGYGLLLLELNGTLSIEQTE